LGYVKGVRGHPFLAPFVHPFDVETEEMIFDELEEPCLAGTEEFD
jgi:hypothetical protein